MIKRPDYSDIPVVKTAAKKREEAQDAAILADIEKIEITMSNKNEEELKNLHVYLDGKYSAYIPNWGGSMYSYMPNYGFDYNYMGIETLIHNLTMIKAKLQGYLCHFESRKTTSTTPVNSVNVQVNNTNSNEITISISFDEARSKIEEMTSLTDDQTKEILQKIKEIEEAVNSKDSKKSKWEKVKPIFKWIADKSFDVGMVLLPLFLKLNGQG